MMFFCKFEFVIVVPVKGRVSWFGFLGDKEMNGFPANVERSSIKARRLQDKLPNTPLTVLFTWQKLARKSECSYELSRILVMSSE